MQLKNVVILEDDFVITLSKEEINNKIWEIKSEIFVPAAASRLVEKSHLEKMINNKMMIRRERKGGEKKKNNNKE